MEKLSYMTYRVMKITQGLMPAGEGLQAIARKLKLSIDYHKISDFVGKNIIANDIIDGFSQSDPTASKKGGSLGELATLILMKLTEVDRHPILFENPLLHAYGSVEQDYLSMRQLCTNIDTIGRGEWDLRLKSMTIPLSDQVFIESRTVGVNSIGHSVIAKRLENSLRIVEQFPSLLDFEEGKPS